jgi:type II secretory pathway component PulJ
MRLRPRNPGAGCACGFTLYEVLVAVMLLALFGVLMARFAVRVVRSMQGARTEATANARIDNAMNVLRNDVWQAVAIQVRPGDRLLLTRADRTQIGWQFGGDHHLRQIGPRSNQHDWGVLSSSIEFTQDGPQVYVTVSDAPHFHGGTFCMVSPMMLAAEGKP